MRKLLALLAPAVLALALAAPASAVQKSASVTACPTTSCSSLIDNDGANYYGYANDTGHDNIADTTAANGSKTYMWFSYENGTWFEIQNQYDFLCMGADSSKYVVWVSCGRGTSAETWRWGGASNHAVINEHFNLGLTAANLSSGAPLYVADGGATAENQWFAQY